nr:putative replication associated protein [Crucivirus sp.]
MRMCTKKLNHVVPLYRSSGDARSATPSTLHTMSKLPRQNATVSSTTTTTITNNKSRLTRIVFTLNHYTDAELASLKLIPHKWMILAKEVGANGPPDIQGATIFPSQKYFSTIKKIPGLERAHIEPMGGSPQQSLDYCTKQDAEAFISGTLPNPGKRSDLHDVVELLKGGSTLDKLVEDTSSAVSYVRYSRGLTLLRQHYSKRRDPNTPPTIIWFYGPTGTQKTRSSFLLSEACFPTESPWISNGPLKWFDGYDGQSTAIFDDYRTSDSTFSYLLRILDRYPIKVEFKGGYVNFAPSTIFVTCPKSPRDLWNHRTPEQLDQLSRRITKELEFPPCRNDFLSLSSHLKLSELELGNLYDEVFPATTTRQPILQLPPSDPQPVYRCSGSNLHPDTSTTTRQQTLPATAEGSGSDLDPGSPIPTTSTPSTGLFAFEENQDSGWPSWSDLDSGSDEPFRRFF